MKYTVEVRVFNTHGVDDIIRRRFTSITDALDYIFDDLEDEEVKILKYDGNKYAFVREGVTYILIIEE